MKDIYFTYATGLLWLVAGLAYGVRLMFRGAARSERVAKVGGTALLGQEVMDWTYWAIAPIVRALVALGITPNGLTWSALVTGAGAGVGLAFGQFGLATLLATISTITDILDGQVARMTNTGSNKGELLDAAIDRYTEFAFVAGLVVYFRDSALLMTIALAALLACFMVSYASAKAEAFQVTPPRGLMRRHERGTYLIVGCGFTSFFGDTIHAHWPAWPVGTPQLVALGVVALLGNYSAVVRLVRISRALV